MTPGSTPRLLLLPSLLLVGACATLVRPQETPPRTTQSQYVAGGDTFQVTVHHDRVAVALAHDVSVEERQSVFGEVGHERIDTLWARHHLLVFASPRTPDEIWRVVGRLEASDVVLHAGLVVEHPGGRIFLLGDELRVRFPEDLSEGEIRRLNRALGTDVVRRSPSPGHLYTLRVPNPGEGNALALAAEYHETGRVVHAYPNFRIRLKDGRYTPDDPFLASDASPRQTHLRDMATTGDGTPLRTDIRAVEAWSYLEERDLSLGVDLLWSHRPAPLGSDIGSQRKDSPRTDACGIWRFERQDLVREGILDGLALTPDDVVVGVLELDGLEWHHEDLCNNLYVNPFEPPGDADGDGDYDDDGNGLPDDVHGWDFAGGAAVPADPDPAPPAGSEEDHGTAVTGLAVAHGNNGQGVAGSCPECLFLPIRLGDAPTVGDVVDALDYAHSKADVINLSFQSCAMTRFDEIDAALARAAELGRDGKGTVVVVAGPYSSGRDPGDPFDCEPGEETFDSSPDVLTVFQNADRGREFVPYHDPKPADPADDSYDAGRFPGGYVTAPGAAAGVFTTDRSGPDGYSDGTDGGVPADYVHDFTGSSASAPMTAGVAGLMLAANPDLTASQARRILKSTADKIQHHYDRDARTSGYDTETGYQGSRPTGSEDPAGYGRVNAFNAVKVAHRGVDVFVRDNVLDWGNTGVAEELEPVPPDDPFVESVYDGRSNRLPNDGTEHVFIPHWRSVDVKVDSPTDGFAFGPGDVSADEFSTLEHQRPAADRTNHVYVRVRNRGPQTARNVRVKLLWTQFSAGLPAFPDDAVWTDFGDPGARTVGAWTQVGVREAGSLAYSAATVAGAADDPAGVVRFEFDAPALDEGPNHYCLLAVVVSDGDPLPSWLPLAPDEATPAHNNVTHRNVRLAADGDASDTRMLIHNPYDRAVDMRLRASPVDGFRWAISPESTVAFDQPFRMQAHETSSLSVDVQTSAGQSRTRYADVTQHLLDESGRDSLVLGGASIAFGPPRTADLDSSPDLRISIDGPGTFAPGEEVRESELDIVVANRGGRLVEGTRTASEAGGYMVDVKLSSDASLPVELGRPSEGFSEDALLRGGRISRTPDLGPGERRSVAEGSFFIPAEIQPGTYCLGVVVDPGDRVRESNEDNNTACLTVRVR